MVVGAAAPAAAGSRQRAACYWLLRNGAANWLIPPRGRERFERRVGAVGVGHGSPASPPPAAAALACRFSASRWSSAYRIGRAVARVRPRARTSARRPGPVERAHVKPVAVPHPDYAARYVAALVLIVEPRSQHRIDPEADLPETVDLRAGGAGSAGAVDRRVRVTRHAVASSERPGSRPLSACFLLNSPDRVATGCPADVHVLHGRPLNTARAGLAQLAVTRFAPRDDDGLTAGGGADTFVFDKEDAGGAGGDTIGDFSRLDRDKIDLPSSS